MNDWIPVKNELPKVAKMCLVTVLLPVKERAQMNTDRLIFAGFLDANGRFQDEFGCDYLDEDGYKPIAWRYYPEAYKGE